MVANAFYTSKGEEEVVATRIAKIATSDEDGKSGGYIQDIIKSDQFSLMANLVISEGIPATSVCYTNLSKVLFISIDLFDGQFI
jgi:hypothetical protein